MHWSELPPRLKIFITSLTLIALPIVGTSAWHVYTGSFGSHWIILTALAVLTVPFFLFLPSVNSIIGIGDAYIMAIAMMDGSAPCVLATLLHTVTASIFVPRRQGIYLYRIFFNSSSMVCGAYLYSNAYGFFNPTHSANLDLIVLPAALMTIVFFLFNSIVTSTAISWASGQTIGSFWTRNCLPLSLDFSISSVSACFLVALKPMSTYLPLAVAPFVGVVWGWNKVIKARAIEAETHLKEQEELYLRTVESLAMAVDAKDQTTYGHIRRVKAYAMGLARMRGLKEPNELMAIETGSLLHDIGKLAIDDYILNKPGKLTRQEFEKMKLHAAAGDEILQQIRFPFPVAKVVRYHHERWDGKGYPDGLKGEEIPLGARILSIVDAYDAIRSSRPYKSAYGRQDAVELIRSQAGSVYDPHLADSFIANIEILEKEAEAAEQDIPKLSFRKYFETVDRALASSNPNCSVEGAPPSATAELVSLFEFCSGPGRQLELQEILGVLGSKLSRLVPYTTSIFFIKKEEQLLPLSITGQYADHFRDLRIELGKGISGWVAAYKTPVLNSEPSLEFYDRQNPGLPLTDTIVVPIVLDSESLGTISLYAQMPDKYTQRDLMLLLAVARISAPLLGELTSSSVASKDPMDPVTRTFRVAYLSVIGSEMLAHAEQTQAPLSLLLIEARGLGQLMSLYGARLVDSLLLHLAQALRSELRETDVLVRFGYQGFATLLPGVRGDQAIRFSHRLHQHINSTAQTFLRAQSSSLEIRIGSSSFPTHGNTVFDLLQAAQQSLTDQFIVPKPNTADTADKNILEFPPRM